MDFTRCMLWVGVLLIGHWGSRPLPADETRDPTAGALTSSLWYDAELGRAVPVTVRDETQDTVNRDSRWLPQADRVRRPTNTDSSAAPGSNGLFGTSLTLTHLIGWSLVFLMVAGVIGMLVYAISRAEINGNVALGGRNGDQAKAGVDQQTLKRMEQLPAELRRTDVNLRDEALRLKEAGRFDQAIILLLGHQLLLLDRAGLLRLSRSKTNGKYVRETCAHDPLAAERLRQTATSFERSYFGRHQVTRDEFESLWQLTEAMERDLTRDGAAA